ncbi:MAG: host specificity protein, partial [Rhizobiaceae bacterium]
LDPLWTHAAVDAVGIDNYMPLSDWRDADYAGGNPDGFAGPYDPDGLRAAIAGGEGYDWYYESAQARSARQRSAITDGAFGKPWIFRYKDILNWWGNAHYNRIAGVEAATPTAWVPQAKSVWFTECGCPAVDKGPNQPNVFPDLKSSESAVPYFSSGGRSDLAQHRFLSAHYDSWDPAGAAFDTTRNPVSAVYGGRMVDVERLYVWAWDARPFPAFPLLTDVWSDGADWSAGHWLNGRLASPALGDLANAILGDHALPAAEVSKADGTVAGYVVSQPDTARSALDPLSDLFGLSAFEQAGDLVFMSEGAYPTAGAVIGEMVAAQGDTPAIRKARDPDHTLPSSAMLRFQDLLNDYQAASAQSRYSDARGTVERTIGFSGVLEKGQADALVADWLRRGWTGRERINFALAAGDADALPGSIVRLADGGSAQDYIVTEIDEGLTRQVSARCIGRIAPFPWRVGLPAYSALPSAIAGEPLAHFLDLPMNAVGVAPESRLRAAVWSKPWKSELLYASPEDTGFGLRSTASLPAVVGELVQPLTGSFTGRVDGGRILSVRLYDGELQSVSRLQMLNGANAAAVLAGNNVWEILQFQNVVETAPSVWALSGLLRGQLGTDDAMVAGAAAGAAFVLIDDAVFPAGLRSAEIGLALNWRVGPAGYDFSGPAFGLYNVTGGVRALTPLSPVHLTAARLTDGSVGIAWIRRGRIDADSWLGTDIPLGEENEAYQVDVSAVGGGAVRTTTVSSQSWTYAAADLSSDFSVLPSAIEITVRQVSASVGPGLPASCTLALG